MNRLIALMKREYWENRIAFRATPIALWSLYVIGILMTAFTFQYLDHDFHTLKEALRYLAGTDETTRAKGMMVANLSASGLFTLVLSFVVFFYLLGSLYDDRKDRSILFWKSLPASDTLTLASKLLTAMFVVPTLFWAAYLVTQVTLYVVASITVMALGENPWTLFVSLGNPFKAWTLVLVSYYAQAVWALPVYGWLMFVSSFAPRIPLLFALVPPAVFAVLQIWIDFLQTFTLKTNLGGLLWEWFTDSPVLSCCENTGNEMVPTLGVPFTGNFEHTATLGNMLDRIFSMQMFWGALIGFAFMAAALWLRRRATES